MILARRLIGLLSAALLLLAPATARTPAPVVVKPALWKVQDSDTTIYLFGTIHVLPDGYKWRTATFENAVSAAQTLTLETVLDEEPGRVARALFALGVQKGLPPIDQRVPEKRRPALAALIQKSGVPQTTLDGMKSWAAAIVLTGPALAQIGVAAGGGAGVEGQLSASFRARGRAVDGFETPEQQLSYFDALPESAQRTFLAETVSTPAVAKADFEAMLKAWSHGDVAAIAKAFNEDAEFTPALREQLVRRRNAAWTETIVKRMARPGTAFVAVGAGHLAGPISVQAMLAKHGYKAVRVQ